MRMIWVISVLFFSAGCTHRYGVGIYNATSAPIDGNVRFEGFAMYETPKGGYIHPHSMSLYDGVPVRVPDTAVVWWKTKDGQVHEREIRLAAKLPKDVRRINFVVGDTDVAVVPLTKKQFRDPNYRILETLRQSVE